MQKLEDILSGLEKGDQRALARAISIVENEMPGSEEILQRKSTNKAAVVVGITGPPGAGKSTLINALASLVAVALCLVFAKETLVLALCATLSCVIHGLRMRNYHTLKTFDDPIVWILHAGYGWLVVGLGLLALTGLGLFTVSAVIHALTSGCIGSMILGMICRVTLGHTGRELKVGTLTKFSFFAIQLAALIRVFGPILTPEYMNEWVIGSALIWCLCFLIYLLVYTPMLFAPRPDGQIA